MGGAELQESLRTLWPDEVRLAVATATGFHPRDRKRDALTFLHTMRVSAASPSGGRQADMMRQYFEADAPCCASGAAEAPRHRDGSGAPEYSVITRVIVPWPSALR